MTNGERIIVNEKTVISIRQQFDLLKGWQSCEDLETLKYRLDVLVHAPENFIVGSHWRVSVHDWFLDLCDALTDESSDE